MDKLNKQAFTEAVYSVVQAIPYGRASSYGAIAKAIGYPNMSRLVGRVMSGCNSAETSVPAHRVVNASGVLSGSAAFGNVNEMQQLLEAEGITVVNNRIRNWRCVFWNPIDEIRF